MGDCFIKTPSKQSTSSKVKIRCISVDDEPLARQGLRLALDPYEDLELVGEFSSGDTVLSAQPEDVDVLFIDIEMPRKNGFDVLHQWRGPLPLVVFITAYDQYAVKAFEQEALDYLLKPIDEQRFAQVVARIHSRLDQRDTETKTERLLEIIKKLRETTNDSAISVKTSDGYFRVNLNDILYFEGVGDHVCVHLKNHQLITRKTLKSFVIELGELGFSQVHKSTLVNKAHISKVTKLKFGDCQVSLSNDLNLRLSRRFKNNLSEFIGTI